MKRKRKYIYCSFFANKKRLGGAYIPEGSSKEERMRIAKRQGILNCNALVFHDRCVYLKFRRRNYGIQITQMKSNGISFFS